MNEKKCDRINRYSFSCFIRGLNKYNDFEVDFATRIKFILKFLKIPFKNRDYVDLFHEGGLYGSYMYIHY